jgi:hypothetical protein
VRNTREVLAWLEGQKRELLDADVRRAVAGLPEQRLVEAALRVATMLRKFMQACQRPWKSAFVLASVPFFCSDDCSAIIVRS